MCDDPLLEQLLSLPSVSAARLSPDGRWVAFVWYRVHANRDVFLVPTDGATPPIALTHTAEETWLVSWTPDSTAVIVHEDHNGDERVSLYRVDIDRPMVMVPLTEQYPPYFLRGGSLHPDGHTLFYGMNYDVARGSAIEPTWIYRHDLRTGERVPIATPEKPAWMHPTLNAAGTHVIYTRKDRHPAGEQLYLVDCEGGEDHSILEVGDQFKVQGTWLPDGQHIAVLSESRDGKRQHHHSFGIYHWPSQTMRWLMDDPQRQIEDLGATPDGMVIVDEVIDARHHASVIDPISGQSFPMPQLPGNLLPLGRAADDAWIALYYSATSPMDVVRFTLNTTSAADLQSLTRGWERTRLRQDQLVSAESLTWQSRDGMSIQGWLYRTSTDAKRAIISVHGGPTAHAEEYYDARIQYFVARGFHVLDVNYRGSTGFGLAFREAIKADGWGGREQDDIASGAETLIAMELAAPGQVGVTGTSYGGYSAWHQITHEPPEVIAAAVPICGMTDLVVDYATTRPDLRPYSEEMIGGRPDQVPERYYERSSINFVHQIRGRLMIVQGAQDPNVTPENVRRVTEQLDRHKISYELLVFDDEGHGIVRPSNQARLYQRIADFFER